MDETARITLRLPTELHARLVEEARADRRSLNSEIVHLLEARSARWAATTNRPDGDCSFLAPAPQGSDSSPA